MKTKKGNSDYVEDMEDSNNTSSIGFTDSDYVEYMEDSKNTSSYVFMSSGGAITWSSRKQPIVTLSTTEAEFVPVHVKLFGWGGYSKRLVTLK